MLLRNLRFVFFIYFICGRFNKAVIPQRVIRGYLLPRMARPRVARGGTASDMKGNCKYVE
jgi:hypothetical protein